MLTCDQRGASRAGEGGERGFCDFLVLEGKKKWALKFLSDKLVFLLLDEVSIL